MVLGCNGSRRVPPFLVSCTSSVWSTQWTSPRSIPIASPTRMPLTASSPMSARMVAARNGCRRPSAARSNAATSTSEYRCGFGRRWQPTNRSTGGTSLRESTAFRCRAKPRTIRSLLASQCALPCSGSAHWLARRLRMVRGFARHLNAVDSRSEVPPVDLLVGCHRRPNPHLYSDVEVAALLRAADGLRQPLRAATMRALIGLLAVSGIRVGEAMGIDRGDVHWVDQTLLVHDTKNGGTRLLPLHPSTIEALRDYGRIRDRLCPRPSAPSLFVSTRGARLTHSTIYPAFRELLQTAGLEPSWSAGVRRPRMHDFRHSLAVATLRDWYRDGGDVAARLPLLSAYLGHTNPAATYWYLSAAPELLALAAERVDRAAGGQS